MIKKDSDGEPLGIYIHIPFCVRKCRYCDFLSVKSDEETRKLYAEALKNKIKICSEKYDLVSRPADSVFIGGGTPGLLSSSQISEILDAVRSSFNLTDDAEISMETNPGVTDYEKLKEIRAAGVNRLSIGVQSFDDNVLKYLGRIHTGAQAEKAYFDARRAGFENINLDFMLGLPYETFEVYENAIKKAVSLAPEHLSCYSLIVEEGTPLYDSINRGEERAPSDEDDRNQYHFTCKFLEENGYRQYEISNFSKNGRECRHNLKYWTEREYIGIGPGAASFLNGRRFAESDSIDGFIKHDGNTGLREDIEITETERMDEFMMLGFRLNRGPDFNDFKAEFGKDAGVIYRDRLLGLKRKNLITANEDERGLIVSAFLTDYGRDFANQVFMEFV